MPQQNHPILLIEDDLSLSSCLRQFLSDHGYKTHSATTARHGWELLHQHHPKLCLLDLNLPDGSGLDILKRLVAQRIEVKVVVMTAFDLKHLRPTDANGILAAWMTKPVQPLELLKVIDKVMASQ